MEQSLSKHEGELVWVDETGIYLDMIRPRGRAPAGQRVVCEHKRKHRRYTLITAVTLEGVLAQRLVQGGMGLEDWRKFCQEDLAPQLREGQIIQLDNLAIHYDQEAYDAVFAKGAVFLFQPPYSPESNPIEEAFSLVKHHLRSHNAQTLPQLRLALAQSLASLTPQHLRSFWLHAQQNVLNW